MIEIKNVLAAPWVYDIAQYLIRGTAYGPDFVSRYIKAKRGDRVLDIGCGTGFMLRYLPDVEYVGLDMSKSYSNACYTTPQSPLAHRLLDNDAVSLCARRVPTPRSPKGSFLKSRHRSTTICFDCPTPS